MPSYLAMRLSEPGQSWLGHPAEPRPTNQVSHEYEMDAKPAQLSAFRLSDF